MANIIEGNITAKGLRFAIVASRFNEFITSKLLEGALCPLKNVQPGDIDMVFVRENSEGEYSGQGAWLYPDSPQELVIQDSVFSRKGLRKSHAIRL